MNAAERFPRAAANDPDWVRQNSLGQNPLWQAEGLAEVIPFRPGMRVLDLGCGKAATSIFLAREFDASVWAVDLTVPPTENSRRAAAAGCASRVFPLRADARNLPVPEEYFDAAVAIDSYYYFGTDERYLPRLCRHLKPGGYVGIVDVGFSREIRDLTGAPAFLRRTFARHWSFVHSAAWWKLTWEKTGLVDVLSSETLPESRRILFDYLRCTGAFGGENEICRAVHEDREGLIVLFRLVARKRPLTPSVVLARSLLS